MDIFAIDLWLVFTLFYKLFWQREVFDFNIVTNISFIN